MNNKNMNQNGIAIPLVLGLIAILTLLLAELTYEVKLNKIKVYNQQDKAQARLNAEAGLNFTLAKLRLYQEGRNKIEKDENLKANFPTTELESFLTQPFVYPIPLSKKANIIQKTAVDDFQKKTLLKGELSVTVSKISGFLNPNSLRMTSMNSKTTSPPSSSTPIEEDQAKSTVTSEPKESTEEKMEAFQIIEEKLVQLLETNIEDRRVKDDDFSSKYGNINPKLLIKEIKYWVNSTQDLAKMRANDQDLDEVSRKFEQANITAKHAPMTSIDEMYLLPSWTDELVELIKDRLSVHEVSFIAVNEITTEDLKVLFPSINNIQIEEFFKYRDGDEDKKIKGKKFKGPEDFKNVIVGNLNIVSDAEYEERMKKLNAAGLYIGTTGKLFKINSRGSFNNAVYNLIAYVDLPIKPKPAKKTNPKTTSDGTSTSQDSEPNDTEKTTQDKNKKEEPVELLQPRVIEIRSE